MRTTKDIIKAAGTDMKGSTIFPKDEVVFSLGNYLENGIFIGIRRKRLAIKYTNKRYSSSKRKWIKHKEITFKEESQVIKL